MRLIPTFLINTLLSNHLYLGYSKMFTSTAMSYDLLGVRNQVYLHRLDHTLLSILNNIKLFQITWANFATLWYVLPEVDCFSVLQRIWRHKFDVDLKRYLIFWSQRWVAGFLSNKDLFVLHCHNKSLFPSFLFFVNQTTNFLKIHEASKSDILQGGVLDTNALTSLYQYSVNANEKTFKVTHYFTNLILMTFLVSQYQQRRKFIIV